MILQHYEAKNKIKKNLKKKKIYIYIYIAKTYNLGCGYNVRVAGCDLTKIHQQEK